MSATGDFVSNVCILIIAAILITCSLVAIFSGSVTDEEEDD